MRMSFLLLLLYSSAGWAGTTFTSGAHQVPLVELYTSEGCSSCPPAERWLSGLVGRSGLWTEFVPMAFHVTYWDNLGWKDVTGQSLFNERQRAIAASWGTDTIYTPCFVRNGVEWHPEGASLAAKGDASVGVLQLTKIDEDTVQVLFAPINGDHSSYQVTVVLLGSGILSKVQRGENAGRDLTHDFAILSINSAALKPDASGRLTAQVVLPKAVGKAPRLALAGWVEAKDSIKPVQATGGWLP